MACSKDESGNKTPDEPTEIEDNEYVLVKWRNDDNAYIMGKSGYLACNTKDLTQADAKVNDVFFHFAFDTQKRRGGVRFIQHRLRYIFHQILSVVLGEVTANLTKGEVAIRESSSVNSPLRDGTVASFCQ